jgi:dihydroorotase
MGKLAFINARIMDPETGLDTQANNGSGNGQLLVVDGKIADFGVGIFPNTPPADAEVIDCGGKLLTPGLIDIQVHFREPGQEYKETIETGTKSAAAGGVTTVVCMANTQPVNDDITVMEFIKSRAREKGVVNLYAYAAITKGLKGEELTEMAMLRDAGAIGFSDDGKPVMNALVMRRAMEYAKSVGLPIAQHAEDTHLSCGGCINEGEISARLGLPGITWASEAVIVARDIILNQLTGCPYHVLHISTAEAVDLVRRAKARGQNVTCEVAPHHFAMNESAVGDFNTNAKMNPPLRSEADRLAIIEGLRDGTIDAIATDHAPHDADSKNEAIEDAPFGIVGLETMLPISLQLYRDNVLSLREVIAKMTYRAADILNLPAGRIAKGAAADLTLIDLDREWNFSNSQLASKSKNSPFEDMKMKGRAVLTVVRGNKVYVV